MVKDFNVGSSSSSFYYFRAINNKIIFRNDNDADRIWVSDGTAEGTKELTDRDGNSLYPYYHYYWDQDKHISQELNGKLYFASRKNVNDVHGLELWTTDGTSLNTYMVKDINPGNRESRPERFFTFNNKVYFSAETAERGRELWVTDGTKIGTQMIHDVYYGYNPSNMNIIGALNNKLYFTAESSLNDNYRIWETTGDVTVDADRLLDVNVTKAINATMEKCKTDPAACGINTVAPKLDAEVLSKKGLGWHMVGTAEAIDDMSIFNGTDTVWKWTGSNWQVYSPDPALQSAINDSNLGNLNRLEAFDGVWIRKK
jgi:ELWxxDGT repeat protein